MKRITAGFAALIVAGSLAACGGSNSTPAASSSNAAQTTQNAASSNCTVLMTDWGTAADSLGSITTDASDASTDFGTLSGDLSTLGLSNDSAEVSTVGITAGGYADGSLGASEVEDVLSAFEADLPTIKSDINGVCPGSFSSTSN